MYAGLALGEAPERRLVQLHAAVRRAVHAGPQHRLLRPRPDLPRASRPRPARSTSSSRSSSMRAPGMSINRLPLFCLGTILATSFAVIFALPALTAANLHARARAQRTASTSSTRRTAATRCSGSTCSGSSATPTSTSSSCPRWAWSPSIVPIFSRRPMVGYAWVAVATVATGDHRLRRLGAPHVRDRPAAALDGVLRGREHDDRDPERHPDLRLDRDDAARPAGAADADAVHPRLHRRCS